MESVNVIFKGNPVLVKRLDKFNRLTILSFFKSNGKLCVKCQCDCGNILESVVLRSLLSGNTKSCGCYNQELRMQRNIKHGDGFRNNKTRLYKIWVDMRRRCNNTRRDKDAKNYACKGIKVAAEWDDFETFKKWALENGYNDTLTIERKDNSDGYNPQNCSWIPKGEQSKNRDSNHYITYNNKTQTLTDWAKEIGIKRTTLSGRLRSGWSIEKALSK